MKNSIRITCIALFLLFGVGTAYSQKKDKILLASAFVKPADKDIAVGLHKLFQEAKRGEYTTIKFEKGTYHIFNDHALERYMFISNHDSGMKRVAFPVIGFDNLTIDGQGSEFIIHGLMIPIAIESSKDIVIKNMSFNYERPTHSEMKVVAVNEVNHTIDFEISKQYPYEIRNGQLIFLKYSGFEHNLDNAIYWDTATNAVAYKSRNLAQLGKAEKTSLSINFDNEQIIYPIDSNSPGYRYRGKEYDQKAQQIKPGLVRISGLKGQLPKTNWILVAKGQNGYNRLAPGIRLLDSENLLINDVTIHHANGMGLIAEGCSNITLDAFKVLPNIQDGRMLSTTADATHFVGCRGKVLIQNCRFENQLDDATNIHGTYLEVTEIKNNVVGSRVGHFQQSGFNFGRPGDTVVVVNPETDACPLAKLTIKSVEIINPRYYEITFNENTGKLREGYYLENTQAYPIVEIKNNAFVNNRARGLLISTPRKVVIENNTFSNMMSAIQCPNEFTFWYESGFVKELVIRNNKFLDSTYGNPKPSPVINIMAVSANNNFIHQNIVIEDNTFLNYSSSILSAEHVRSLIFRNNIISYSGKYPIQASSPIVHLTGIGNADLSNNRYDNKFKTFLATDSTFETINSTKNKAVNKDETR